jgi:SpoVK/Ycf46/Vps4 family AAA+-type ATPase
LSTLLVELDGITSGNDINVTGSPAPSRGDVVVGATASEKSLLDKALKRPGRLEEHIELSLPSREDRLCYFEQEISSRSPHTGHDREEGDEDGGGGQGVDAGLLAALADRTAGYSYARLNLIVQEASHSALRARLGSSSVENRVGSNCTTTRDEAREAFFEFLRKKM